MYFTKDGPSSMKCESGAQFTKVWEDKAFLSYINLSLKDLSVKLIAVPVYRQKESEFMPEVIGIDWHYYIKI